ncbi:MAG: hypothetical protein WCA47_11090, partial [Terriglobales bacterium]
SQLCLLVVLLTPVCGFASNYCIATNGGFGPPSFGTTFIEPSFAIPAAGKCAVWVGFTKTASTVVLMSSGQGCLSTDGTVLTVAVSSQDPSFFGTNYESDYIQLSRSKPSGPFTSGSDMGAFGGDALRESCTSRLLNLPSSHD